MCMRYFVLVLLFVSVLLSGSCSKKTTVQAGAAKDNQAMTAHNALPPCIIYKTKADYSKQVPVGMSEDKKSIVSYPDVKDVMINGSYPYPLPLEDGFLLDNKGIGPDVAFLDYTYEAYSRLPKTPDAAELMKHILVKNPLTAMYRCGSKSQYRNIEAELNVIIHSGLKGCKRLK